MRWDPVMQQPHIYQTDCCERIWTRRTGFSLETSLVAWLPYTRTLIGMIVSSRNDASYCFAKRHTMSKQKSPLLSHSVNIFDLNPPHYQPTPAVRTTSHSANASADTFMTLRPQTKTFRVHLDIFNFTALHFNAFPPHDFILLPFTSLPVSWQLPTRTKSVLYLNSVHLCQMRIVWFERYDLLTLLRFPWWCSHYSTLTETVDRLGITLSLST